MEAEVHSASRTAPVSCDYPSSLSEIRRTFKIIVIGEANVGKTCLTFRFCNGRFPDSTEATIGVDFRERCLLIDGEYIRVQLWDTAGQERFRHSFTSHYYRKVNGIVFVYDIACASSFNALSYWIQECQRHGLQLHKIPALVIGNKCDCVDKCEVKTEDSQRFADSYGLPLFETSAKADLESDHVEAIFMTLIHKLREAKTLSVSTAEEQEQLIKLSDSSSTASYSYCDYC